MHIIAATAERAAFVWHLPSETIVEELLLPVAGTAQKATQGQNDSFVCQLPYKCYLEAVASVGD